MGFMSLLSGGLGADIQQMLLLGFVALEAAPIGGTLPLVTNGLGGNISQLVLSGFSTAGTPDFFITKLFVVEADNYPGATVFQVFSERRIFEV